LIQIKEKHARLIGIPLLGVVLSFIFCPDPIPSIGKIIKSIAFVFIFWQGIFSIIHFFRKKFPKINQTSRRIIYSLLCAITYIINADLALQQFFTHFFPEHRWIIDSYFLHALKTIFISILVAMVYELTYFYARWNQANLETEKLKTQQVVSQFESLKNQISPHFLFNSLNTLAAIIPENPDQAILFTQKLADVYRYILKYQEEELVTLSTELEFIESFLFLLKIRYPENLNVHINISESDKRQFVAPLTIQLLVENAIKHNVISKTQPLEIEIYSEKRGVIIVKNKLQKKTISSNSTQTGLENIKKRYQYLSDKAVDVIATNSNFMVAIPLLQLSKEGDL
jgi:hypothetical protein